MHSLGDDECMQDLEDMYDQITDFARKSSGNRVYVCMYVCIFTPMHAQRERERERCQDVHDM